ncbi:MAG: LPS assembly protein LptD [Terriglobia bacterium]|jgi:LPS-assembly protein|nr:LPS assembly protein LptD [Terriglobia bacterium]
MSSRNRIFITVLTLSHLLLLPTLVRAQAIAAAPQQTTMRSPTGEDVTIYAKTLEKQGNIYTLQGDVEIDYRQYVLRAEEITYNHETGDVTATGRVVLDGGPHDEHVQANHATYNIETGNGKFYGVIGTIGTRVRGSGVVLTSSNPFLFEGKVVIKSGDDRLIVEHGTVTTCTLPNPKWTFNAGKIDVVIGEDAKLYHADFRIFKVPVFYFPYATHPVDNLGRRTGFLVPSLGQSSRKGFILGDSVYWAINRSMDMTLGAEYWSARGWAQHVDYRARPSENSYIDMKYFGVLDRGDPATHQDQGGEDVTLDAGLDLKHGFRAVSSIEYLSRYVFRLAFAETFTQAVNSEVTSNAFLYNDWKGFSFGLLASRYQNFQSTEPGDEIKLIHMPSLEVSSIEKPLFGSRVMYSFDTAAEGVSRREPDFVTNPLDGRFDLHPKVSLPLILKGWDIRPEIGVWETYYSQQIMPVAGSVGIPIDKGLNRRAVESTIEVRPPALERVFDHEVFGRKLKHVIEPRFTYRYVTGVEDFHNIIRFDWRDILTNTSEAEVGLVQRLYAKRELPKREQPCEEEPAAPQEHRETTGAIPGTTAVQPKCEDEGVTTREILSWELKAKYFADTNFGGALVDGRRNVFYTTADYAGIAFLTDPRRWAPVVSRLRVSTSPNTDVQWELDYDTKKGRINASTAIVNYRIGEFFIGGSQAFLHAPGEVITSTNLPAPSKFNQFRLILGYGHQNKRGFSAGTTLGFDSNFHYVQYGAAQTSYNWDCCGVSIEYRRFALGSVRNENQFRFALSLANIGTFGNLRRQERLF